MLLKASLAVATLAATVSSTSRADGVRDGQLVDVDARYVFVPVGFDDNDEATLTVDGYLPSGCYRLTRPEVHVDLEAKTISVRPMARYFDVPCIEALVPYHFDVALGHLPEGQFQIKANVDGGLTESLPVAEATSAGPDDYLYAPIDNVSVDQDLASGKVWVTLTGRLTSGCLEWDRIVVQDNGKSINLLPILKTTTGTNGATGQSCDASETPFKKRVELPASVTAGRHLLNVRSLSGRAVNVLFFKAANR